MDGYEAVRKIKDNENTRHIPVVIVTALNDVANQLKSIEAGADDFLSKPIEEKLLIAKVKLLSSLNLETKRNNMLVTILDDVINGNISVEEAKNRFEDTSQ